MTTNMMIKKTERCECGHTKKQHYRIVDKLPCEVSNCVCANFEERVDA